LVSSPKEIRRMVDPERTEFLEFCRLVLKGEALESELPKAITAARNNLTELRANFLVSISREPLNVQEETKPAMNETLSALDAYSEALNLIEDCAGRGVRSALAKGMESVRQAIQRAESAFRRYEVSLLSTNGPTELPGYNLLAGSFEALEKGEATQEELLALIQSASTSTTQSMESFNRYLHLSEVAQLKEAYEDHEKALDELKLCLLNGKPLEAALFLFEQSCRVVEKEKIEAEIRILTDGPTPSPSANFMINLSTSFEGVKAHSSYFAHALLQLQKEYRHFQKELEAIKPRASEETTEKCQTGLQVYEAALAKFVEFEKLQDPKLLVKGSRLLRQAILELYDAFKQFHEAHLQSS